MSEPESSSLEKGLTLLQELATSEGGMTVAELAQATGVNRTSIYRLCNVLSEAGWIQLTTEGQGSRRRRLDLGPRAFGLAVLVSAKFTPEVRLRPVMDTLSRSVGETVHAGILDDVSVIHIARSVPDAGLHMAAPLGSREFAHVTALGKAILATLSREEILRRYPQEQLPARTAKAISSRTALLDELERIAETGYAIDDEESRAGVRCVGAPVFDASGAAMFAISVTSMPIHLEAERLDAVAQAVVEAAATATASLGAQVPSGWACSASLTGNSH